MELLSIVELSPKYIAGDYALKNPGGAKPGKLFDQGARFFVEDTAAEHNLAKDIQRVLLHTMLICSPVHF